MSEDLEIPDPVDLFDTETRFTHLPFLHRARTVGLPQVQTPYSILERCHELLDRPIPSNIMYEIGGAFLNEAMKDTAKSTGSLLYWALLPLVVNLGPATTSLFEESYLSYFDPKYEPKADDDFLQVNVPLSMWPLDTPKMEHLHAWENWSLIPERTKSNAVKMPLSVILKRPLSEIFEEPKPKTIRFRAARTRVVQSLEFDRTVTTIQGILTLLLELGLPDFPKKKNVEELTDLIRHPREEYKSFYLAPKRTLVVDRRSYYVDIL